MNCPKCDLPQRESLAECPRCGIVFAKYRRVGETHGLPRNPPEPKGEPSDPRAPSEGGFLLVRIWETLVQVPEDVSMLHLLGRGGLYGVLVFWGLKFIGTPIEANYAGNSFMHLVNLPFHEAGHFILGFFGRFVTVLGGSLMQLLVPLVCIIAFLSTARDPYAASVSTWWLGESFMDLAPYINDARDLQLILLGGVTGRDVEDYHDWQYLLGRLNLLEYDHGLARFAHGLGALLIGVAFLWGGYILYRQLRVLTRKASPVPGAPP